MKKSFQFLLSSLSVLVLTIVVACNGQYAIDLSAQSSSITKAMTVGTAYNCNFNQIYTGWNSVKQPPQINTDIKLQMGESLTKILEDKKGNLWLGTAARGVALFNGKALFYFSKSEGLSGNSVRDIAEDNNGNLWFATENGVTKFDGKQFTRFSKTNGLNSEDTWSILADKKGEIWIGTKNGVMHFDGKSFSEFELPKPAIEQPVLKTNQYCVKSILEDKAGNIWLGRDGYGVCKYDGKSFTHFTKADGLCSNNVVSIEEDHEGKMWFGSIETKVPEKGNLSSNVESGDGGLSSFDGKTFTRYPEIKGLSGNDIGPIYKDRMGDLWIASKHNGVYLYTGNKFDNLREDHGLKSDCCVQSIFEDSKGQIWFGYSNGISRMGREGC